MLFFLDIRADVFTEKTRAVSEDIPFYGISSS